MNSQLVGFLVADGLESADQVGDYLHPVVLRLLVLRHQVQLSDAGGRLEDDREGRVFIKVLNLRTGK